MTDSAAAGDAPGRSASAAPESVPQTRAPFLRAMEGLLGVPSTHGNRVRVLRNGDEIFAAMLDDIARAERTIDFLTYVFWGGPMARRFAAALAARARAGVRVRVIIDAFGSRPLDDGALSNLRDAGVVVEVFRPLSGPKFWKWNMRTHRRVLVCDGKVAYTGGVGIAEEWTGDASSSDEWRDTHFRVEGPAVDGIGAAFLSDWLETAQPLMSTPDEFPPHDAGGSTTAQVFRASAQLGWNDAALAVAGLLGLARERIRITSAYLRPPQHFRDLLFMAVERGVEVEIVAPGPHGEPPFLRLGAEYQYEWLVRGGVGLWCYQPTMLHAKVITVDGTIALVGSTNFDARSFAVNEQIGLLLHDADIVAELDAHFEADRAVSRPIDLEKWRRRGLSQRALEAAAHFATFGLRGGGVSAKDQLAYRRKGVRAGVGTVTRSPRPQ